MVDRKSIEKGLDKMTKVIVKEEQNVEYEVYYTVTPESMRMNPFEKMKYNFTIHIEKYSVVNNDPQNAIKHTVQLEGIETEGVVLDDKQINNLNGDFSALERIAKEYINYDINKTKIIKESFGK